jgi:hypothetical protein
MTNTGSDDLAKCGIQRDKDLDAKNSSLQVEATLLDVLLLDDEGEPIKEAGNPVHPSILHTATN